MKEYKVFAPATVSNVGPGFDLMGFAIEKPGDILLIRKNQTKSLRIVNNTDIDLPVDPVKNVAGVAINALLDSLDIKEGFDIVFEQKIQPGSGIGSSAASCTAAVFGVNEFLGRPFSSKELINFALKGEFLASGSLHADNIAPAMLGGIVLVRSYSPFDVIQLKSPANLWCTVIHPEIEIKTAESRKEIPDEISLKMALAQCGNLASLVAGITTSDFRLIAKSLDDHIAEPYRRKSIPGYEKLKNKLKGNGILGMNISGSGPSLFAFSESEKAAKSAAELMSREFNDEGLPAKTYCSKISERGTVLTGV